MSTQSCECVWFRHIIIRAQAHMVRFLVLAALLSAVLGGRAPDKSPEVPDDFCDKKWGTMTRSTGECMCHPKAKCEGKNCESGQGMIW